MSDAMDHLKSLESDNPAAWIVTDLAERLAKLNGEASAIVQHLQTHTADVIADLKANAAEVIGDLEATATSTAQHMTDEAEQTMIMLRSYAGLAEGLASEGARAEIVRYYEEAEKSHNSQAKRWLWWTAGLVAATIGLAAALAINVLLSGEVAAAAVVAKFLLLVPLAGAATWTGRQHAIQEALAVQAGDVARFASERPNY